MSQGGEGIRVTGVAPVGGSITVNVGPNDTSVEIGPTGSSNTSRHEVEANKDVEIPIPSVPAGTILIVTVGKGARKQRIQVEVVAPSP
jgi:hypothetical protein